MIEDPHVVVRDPAGRDLPANGPLRAGIEQSTLADGTAILRPSVANEGASPVRLGEVAVRVRALPAGGTATARVFVNGWCTASPALFLPADARGSDAWWRFPPPTLLPGAVRRMILPEGASFPRRRGGFESEWVTALVAPDGSSTAIGCAGFEHHFTSVRVDAPAGTVEVAAPFDGAVLAPGAVRPLEPVAAVGAPTPFDALRAWAGVAASRGFSRATPLRLWCSWYSGFHDRIDAASMAANLEGLRPHRDVLPCFQVDDGWQRAIGDWTSTNEKFPAGLPALAADVAAAGFSPGLWLAPFSVSPRSEAFRGRPDLVVRSPSGRPVRAGFVMGSTGPRSYHAIDTTHPDAAARLGDLFRELWAMGWRVFKLDFLTAACVAGVRADPAATTCEAYRRGLRAIRDALPPEAVLLSGIAPVFAGAGLLDAQRTGPDTFYGRPAWRTAAQGLLRDRCTPGVRNSLAAAISRSFTDGVLFSADTDTSVAWGVPEGVGRMIEAVTLLAGGTSGVGHDFRTGPRDLSAFASLAAAAAARGGVRVPDLAEGPFPRHLVSEDRSGRPALYAVLNPDASPARIPVRLDVPAHATDAYTGARVRLEPGVPVDVPARDARVFVLDPDRRH
ncbi:MAG: alpha-galactosidase [Deltaproteobacteria bacterium]|nr:alpha-galactosidase [Deltaproteobacteria bacterium]